MLKFLCVLTVFMVSAGAFAQNVENELFPELQKRPSVRTQPTQPEATRKKDVQSVPSLFENESAEAVSQRENEAIRSLFNETEEDRLSDTLSRGAAQTQQRQLSKAEENFFVFSPSEIQIVVPTIARFQFCTSHLTLSNNTSDVILKSLSVVFKYANIQVPYTYTGMNPGDSQSGTVALGGEACQVLLKVPEIDVKKCLATRMVEREGRQVEEPLSVTECTSKVKYLPR